MSFDASNPTNGGLFDPYESMYQSMYGGGGLEIPDDTCNEASEDPPVKEEE